MKLPDKMHWPRVLLVVFLFVLASVLAMYKEDAKQIIKSAFDSGKIPIVVWIYVGVAVISRNLFLGNGRSSHFESYAETIFSIATYGLAGTTSVSLLQGVYLQYFYNIQYFYNFGALDLASIALVSSYLLIYVGIATTRMLSDIIFRVKGTHAEPKAEL